MQKIASKLPQQTSTSPSDSDMATAREGFLYYAQELCPGFQVDDQNKDVIELLLKYITGQKEAEREGLVLHKGLFLHGGIGCGKTILIQALVKIRCYLGTEKEGDFSMDMFNERRKYNYRIISSRKIRDLYLSDGIEEIEKLSASGIKHLAIDDIGLEGRAKHFGNEVSPVEELILDRYEDVINPKNYKYQWPIYLTSNHTGKQLGEFYGERFVSRVREMCNDIYLPGGDRRK